MFWQWSDSVRLLPRMVGHGLTPIFWLDWQLIFQILALNKFSVTDKLLYEVAMWLQTMQKYNQVLLSQSDSSPLPDSWNPSFHNSSVKCFSSCSLCAGSRSDASGFHGQYFFLGCWWALLVVLQSDHQSSIAWSGSKELKAGPSTKISRRSFRVSPCKFILG